MMESKIKRPGSVRLNNEQYEEMKDLGFTSESTYVKYKMEQGELKLEALKNTDDTIPVMHKTVAIHNDPLHDQLKIQRLTLENAKLMEKVEQLSEHQKETLSGVPHKVHEMLQEELQKRDFERLKEVDQEQKKQLEKLEQKLEKSQNQSDEKQKEIEALVKKLGFVELGKVLLPSAISGLAKQYPTQMKGIAGTLGRLGIGEAMEEEATPENSQANQLSEIYRYLQDICSAEQFQELMELIYHIGEHLKVDQDILQKVGYYLQQLIQKTTAQEAQNTTQTTDNT